MADLDHALQTDQALLVNLISRQQFGVVAEIAQEPGELPQGFGGAVQASGNGSPGERLRLDYGKAEKVKRLLGMPAVLGTLYPDQEQAVRDCCTGASRFMQALDMALHAAPSFWPM